MRKNSNTPVKAGSLASLGIGLTILVVVLGIVAIGFHMVESLDDNSKKLKLYEVKKNEIRKTAAHDFLLYTDEKLPLHPESRQLARKGDRLCAKQPQKAITFYEQSIQSLLNETHGQKLPVRDAQFIGGCHHRISQCYIALRQYQRALEEATLAINADPTTYGHYLLRAQLYSLTDRKSLSEADVEKAHLVKNAWGDGHSVAADALRFMLDSDAAPSSPNGKTKDLQQPINDHSVSGSR